MNKRSFAIVALSIVCLATILAAVPTNSLVGYYDPWLDYDENGTIDMKDVAASARAFGSLGDPTKNVNVMNWPVAEQVVVWWDQYLGVDEGLWSADYESNGFSQLHITLWIADLDEVYEEVVFAVFGVMWNESRTSLIRPLYHQAIYTMVNHTDIISLSVPSQAFTFYISTLGPTDAYISLNYYLTWV